MSSDETIPNKNTFDSWQSISTALIIALVGYSVMVSIPVLSTAWVNILGLTEEQVGRVAGADLGGLSIGALFTAIFVARVNRRILVAIGLVLSIGANALCIGFVEYEQVLWLRLIAGFGSGIFTSIAVVTLGGTSNPVRAFNFLLLGFAFFAALELHLLPQLSMSGIYTFFILLNVTCFVLLPWLPSKPLSASQMKEAQAAQEDVAEWKVPRFLPIFCLVAICFTYINIGGYFTYIELAAHADGIDEGWIGPILTWSSVFSVVGCILAFYCYRFGLFNSLFVSLFMMAVIVIMLTTGITDINIMISLFGFMALWTFVDVYQMALMSHMDRSGTLVALIPSVQGFGQFIGPNISASVIGAGLGYSTMFVVSGSMVFVAMLIYMGVQFYMQKQNSLTLAMT
jgi:predicted MFS family arabinose efflux permease